MKHIHRSALFLCLCLLCPSSTHAQRGAPTPEIPLIPGLTFVLAVHNSNPAPSGSGIAVGDYEMVVGVESVTSEYVVLKTKIDAEDESQRQLQLDIERRVPLTDLEAARLQILGFHTQDPVTLSGTTALGPSLAVLRDLRTTGQSAYSVKNFNHLSTEFKVHLRGQWLLTGAVLFPLNNTDLQPKPVSFFGLEWAGGR